MATIELSDIQAEAQERFGDLRIEAGDDVIVLTNPLRLDRQARSDLFSLFEKKEERDEDGASAEDVEDVFESVFTLVSSKAHAAKLNKLDAPVKSLIFEKYMKVSQAGEASGSEN